MLDYDTMVRCGRTGTLACVHDSKFLNTSLWPYDVAEYNGTMKPRHQCLACGKLFFEAPTADGESKVYVDTGIGEPVELVET